MIMIQSQELLQLASDQFELRCGRIRLFRSASSSQSEYWGSGYLKQAGLGRLSLVVFIDGPVPLEESQYKREGEAGTLIPDDRYFEFEAHDFEGRTWWGARLRPSFSSIHGPGDRELWMAEATVPEIHATEAFSDCRPHLTIWYRGTLEFPFTVPIERIERLQDRELSRSSSFGASEFSAAAIDFFVRQEDSYLVVSAYSPTEPIPVGFEERVTEALEFVLARRLSWTCTRRIESSTCSMRVTGAPLNEQSGRMQHPVPFRRGITAECRSTVKLLRKVIGYLARRESEKRPPLSISMRSAIDGGRLPLDSHALDLSVAVEAILRSEYEEVNGPAEELLQDRDTVQMHLQNIDLSENFRKRISGFLDSVTNPSAKQQLLRLELDGKVTRKEVKAWEYIRHRASHGNYIEDLDQKYLDNFHRLMTLFHKLVFDVVGYSGTYRDYGERRWPEREFV